MREQIAHIPDVPVQRRRIRSQASANTHRTGHYTGLHPKICPIFLDRWQVSQKKTRSIRSECQVQPEGTPPPKAIR